MVLFRRIVVRFDRSGHVRGGIVVRPARPLGVRLRFEITYFFLRGFPRLVND